VDEAVVVPILQVAQAGHIQVVAAEVLQVVAVAVDHVLLVVVRLLQVAGK